MSDPVRLMAFDPREAEAVAEHAGSFGISPVLSHDEHVVTNSELRRGPGGGGEASTDIAIYAGN